MAEKLTYEELVGILCNLAVRLNVVEELLLDLIRQEEFKITEILKCRMDMIEYGNKTPFNRLLQLESETQEHFKSHRDKKDKYNIYIP